MKTWTDSIRGMSVMMFILCQMSIQAMAFNEIAESNEMPSLGHYKFGALLQSKLSDGAGTNFTVFGDGSLHEEMSWRAFAGGGSVDFYAGGSMKWVPIPDYRNQPALGLKGEFTFGRQKNESITVARAVPIVSKKLNLANHYVVPYAGLPLGISAGGGRSDFFANLAGGSEVVFDGLDQLEFNAEIGINLTKSFSYIGIGVTYLLDTGYRSKRSK